MRDTAIARTKPSLPMRWLVANGHVRVEQDVLDYGCGRGMDVSWLREESHSVYGSDVFIKDGWDPVHREWVRPPYETSWQYDVVTMIYVANVIPPGEERDEALMRALSCARPYDGRLFVAVRRDIPAPGKGPRPAGQFYVELPEDEGWELLVEKKGKFAIYRR
jgi:hypothetical protein